MADINNDSTLKEDQKVESPPDSGDSANSDEKNKDEKETKDTKDVKPDDVKDKKIEKENASDEEDASNAEEEDEDSDEEELPPGLLEQPLEVSGKREKKKVDRLSATMAATQSTEKKKLEIEEGTGVKLGEIAIIENQLNSVKAADLKSLHRLLFLRLGTQHDTKKNIRQFSGFSHSKESKEHEKRTTQLNKMHLAELKPICSILALEKSGTKKDIIDRIIEFLMEPVDKGLKVPQSKRAKQIAKSKAKSEKAEAKKRKRTSKKPKKKVENDEEDEDDAESDDIEESMSEQEIEEESEEEAPKKKKAKVEPKKKATPKASPKVNGKKEKSPKKKEPKKAAPKEMSDLSDDSDDDEPIAKLIKPSPPSNDEIKELVKKILDGADLESVTMKTVVKEVYSKYPTFDLSDRKDFIKSTVREVIS